MFEIRIHGRGGQGVVTAAEMLSIAAFEEGKHSQAIPSFGSEPMGAPVVAYVRIDDKPIELYEPVLSPDLLIIQDPTLFPVVDVFNGLAPDGLVLINTSRGVEELHIEEVLQRLPEHHAHEYRCLEKQRIGDEQLLVAGVIDTLTNFVEHPQVVADRIERVARAVGDPSRVVAGTDCGFDTSAGMGRLADDVVWAKLRSLAQGARLATQRLL